MTAGNNSTPCKSRRCCKIFFSFSGVGNVNSRTTEQQQQQDDHNNDDKNIISSKNDDDEWYSTETTLASSHWIQWIANGFVQSKLRREDYISNWRIGTIIIRGNESNRIELNRIALVGDSCHGMYSFFEQGAAAGFLTAILLLLQLLVLLHTNNNNINNNRKIDTRMLQTHSNNIL